MIVTVGSGAETFLILLHHSNKFDSIPFTITWWHLYELILFHFFHLLVLILSLVPLVAASFEFCRYLILFSINSLASLRVKCPSQLLLSSMLCLPIAVHYLPMLKFRQVSTILAVLSLPISSSSGPVC